MSSSVESPLSASMMTSPPRPPSPPFGPPNGTNFSRRNDTHPAPPSPERTNIFTSSTNCILLLPNFLIINSRFHQIKTSILLAFFMAEWFTETAGCTREDTMSISTISSQAMMLKEQSLQYQLGIEAMKQEAASQQKLANMLDQQAAKV